MQQPDSSIIDSKSAEEVFLVQLRQSTAAHHKKLESHPLSASLMQPSVSLSLYADYLFAMRGVMKEYDEIVLPFLKTVIPDTEVRKKSAAIENDIAYLEMKGVSGRKNELFRMPELTNRATALGIAYVLEGSALGGRIIIKHLQRFLPVTEDKGALFFKGYGNDTGLRWKQFLAVLTNFGIEEKCGNNIIAGAQACFDSIYNHFDKSYTPDEV